MCDEALFQIHKIYRIPRILKLPILIVDISVLFSRDVKKVKPLCSNSDWLVLAQAAGALKILLGGLVAEPAMVL